MTKKIILSLFLSSTLLLTSCGTKPLGTFEEEIKAEQQRYVENINKSFEFYEESNFWKFSSEWKVSLALDAVGLWKLKYAFDIKWDSISEDEVAFNWSLGLDILSEFDKEPKNEMLKEMAWTWVNLSLKWKLALLWKNIYANLEDLKLDIKNPNNIPQLSVTEMFNVSKIVEKVWKKWLKYDLSSLWDVELEKAFNNQKEVKQYMVELKNSFVKLASSDILTAWEKTTYEKKEAYKFTVDEVKFKTSLKEFFKNFLTATSKISASSEEELKEVLANVDKEIDSIKISESEGYLVRASGNDVDVIFKKIVLEKAGEENKLEVSLALLSDWVKFLAAEQNTKNELVFNVGKKESQISFKLADEQIFALDYKNGKWKFEMNESLKIVSNFSLKGKNISWDLKVFESKESEKELFTVNYKVSSDMKYSKWNGKFLFDLSWDFISEDIVKQWIEKVKFDLKIDSKQTKNDKITIDEKSILWEEKSLTLEEYMKNISEIFWAVPSWDFEDMEVLTGSVE